MGKYLILGLTTAIAVIAVGCAQFGRTPTAPPTPTPAPAPWSGRDDVDDVAVRDAFMASLTAEQRVCVLEAFDDQRLLALVEQQLDQGADRRGFGPDEGSILAPCMGKAEDDSLMPEFLRAVSEVLPQVPAPHGVGARSWPGDRLAVMDLMQRVASRLGGTFDEQGERFWVALGTDDRTALVAMDWSAFAPSQAYAEQMMAAFALGADWEVLAAARDDGLLWVRWGTTANGDPFEVLQWGQAGSVWTFAANAPTLHEVDAAVTRFAQLAGGG